MKHTVECTHFFPLYCSWYEKTAARWKVIPQSNKKTKLNLQNFSLTFIHSHQKNGKALQKKSNHKSLFFSSIFQIRQRAKEQNSSQGSTWACEPCFTIVLYTWKNVHKQFKLPAIIRLQKWLQKQMKHKLECQFFNSKGYFLTFGPKMSQTYFIWPSFILWIPMVEIKGWINPSTSTLEMVS